MAKILSLPAISNSLPPFKPPNAKPQFSNPHRCRRTTSLNRSSLADQSLSSAKRDLLDLISDQDRGIKTQNNPSKLSEIVKAIDAMAVLGSDTVTTGPSLSGTWRLMWTTEKEQLFIIKNAFLFGTQTGDVLQVIDVEKGVLNNVITFPPRGVFFVRSTIEIASTQRVDFRFTSAVLRAENWELPLPPFGQGCFRRNSRIRRVSTPWIVKGVPEYPRSRDTPPPSPGGQGMKHRMRFGKPKDRKKKPSERRHEDAQLLPVAIYNTATSSRRSETQMPSCYQ